MTIFLKNDFGRLYLHPSVVTPLYTGLVVANFALNAAWIIIWGYQLIVLSSVGLFLIAGTNVAATVVLAVNLAADSQRLKREQPKIYW